MIDRYDAPEGMVAIRMWEDCEPCCFYDPKDETGKCDHSGRCYAPKRKDGESVYFVKREDFEKMLIKEIRGFYQVDDFSIYRDGVNIRIDAQNKT
jgi:hypothetical protein